MKIPEHLKVVGWSTHRIEVNKPTLTHILTTFPLVRLTGEDGMQVLGSVDPLTLEEERIIQESQLKPFTPRLVTNTINSSTN